MANERNALIAFQGAPGAYSHLACRRARPELQALPCASFDEMFNAVTTGQAQLAMVPVENSSAGRVADIHHMLPNSGLPIVGEHFEPVNHCLLAREGVTLAQITEVQSHVQALAQCRNFIRSNRLEPVARADTAGSAADVAQASTNHIAAIASELAADIYGLNVLQRNIEDNHDNTTRFCIVAREPMQLAPSESPLITTLVFRVRSVPASLYKALGGFATNSINITKLESYILDGSFNVAQFYVDFEGHPDSPGAQLALEELQFFSEKVEILGTYKASPLRR